MEKYGENKIKYDAKLDKTTLLSKPSWGAYLFLAGLGAGSLAAAAGFFWIALELNKDEKERDKGVEFILGGVGGFFGITGFYLVNKFFDILNKQINKVPCYIFDGNGIYSLKDKLKVSWNSIYGFESVRITNAYGFVVEKQLHFLNEYKKSLLIVSSRDFLMPLPFDSFCKLIDHYSSKYIK